MIKESSDPNEHSWANTLNIDKCKPGDKVLVVTKDGEVWNGTDSDKEQIKEHLTIGVEYTIERIDIHSWHTNIYLKEIPNIPFNSSNLYSKT